MNKLYRISRLILPAFFALLILLVACHENSTEPAKTNSVAGILSDEQGNSVPEAVIEVLNNGMAIAGVLAKDTTDEDGNYLLSNLPDDISKLNIRITHPDFKLFEGNLRTVVGDKDRKKCGIKIQHDDSCKGKLVIITRKASDSTSITAVEVRLSRDGKLIRKAYTNEQGMLTFEKVCPGKYGFRGAKYGYRVIEQAIEISGDQTINIEPYFLNKDGENDSCCHGIYTLTIKDSATKAIVTGVTVNIWKGSTKLSEFKTDEKGQVYFRELCSGEYGISFNKEGYNGREFGFNLGCNDTVYAEKYMLQKSDSCCHGQITVIPKDSKSGEVLNGAKVMIYSGGKLLGTQYVEGGSTIFKNLCEGVYGFDIYKENHKHVELSVTMTCNAQIEQVKELVQETPPDSCCNGVLYVTPKDSKDGHLLKGAIVKLRKGGQLLTTLTLEGEYVVFTKLCPGLYSLLVTDENYKGIEFPETYVCNDTLSRVKLLDPIPNPDSCCNGSLQISPRDKDKPDQVLTGAIVKLYKGGQLLTTLTVESQYVTFTKLCAGTYSVSISAANHKAIEFSVTYTCNEEQKMEKYLQSEQGQDTCCNGSLQISPRDKDKPDQVLTGAIVKLYKGGQLLTTLTVESQYVTFTKLCAGTYSVSISAANHKAIEFSVTFTCNEQQKMEKLLQSELGQDTCCKGTMSFLMKDSVTNNVLANVTVNVWKGSTKVRTGVTNAEGRISFGEFCTGEYQIGWSKDGYTGKEYNINMWCNEAKTINGLLIPKAKDTCCTAILRIKIIDSVTELPIEGAQLDLYIGDKHVREAQSNAEGWITIDGLCAPTTYFGVLSKDGYNNSEKITRSFTECNTLTSTIKLVQK